MSQLLRVLFVEDNEGDAVLLARVLEEGGYKISWERADTPEGLRAALQREDWQLIVSDFAMPRFNGLEASQICHENGRDAPFILVSGSIGERTAVEVMKAGASDFMLKENLERLVPVVKRCLKDAEARRKRREAEAALRESEELFRALSASSPVGIYMADQQGHTIYTNPRWREIFGLTLMQSVGEGWLNGVHPEDREMVQVAWNACVAAGGEFDLEFRIQRPDGASRWVQSRSVPRRAGKGEVMEHIGTIEDITERKQAEEAQARLVTAIEQAAEVIVITDPNATIQYVNPAFERITGYTRAEALGQNPRILKSGKQDAAFYQQMWVALTRGEVWHGSFINRKKDGSLYQEEATIAPVRDASGKIVNYVAVKHDVTHERQLQRQFIQQERLRALGQMASGITHDFNNALMPVLGFSELLLKDFPKKLGPKKAMEFVKMIHTSAEDAAEIVRRMREFSRQRDPNEQFKLLEANTLITQAVALTQPKWKDQVQANGCTVRIKTDLSEVPPIFGEESELRELLTNLIFNAVDAMPQGGTITLSSASKDNNIELRVADTGPGMTEEVRQRCFEPFFTTKGATGTGMGLAMVHGIVKRHAGTIEIESKPGQGTTVIIRLPIQRLEKASATPVEVAPVKPSLRILVVDDDPLGCKTAIALLSRDSHTVEAAGNGNEALAAFKRARFDVVLADRAMPDMSGEQLAAAIREIALTQPIIMVTGFSDMMKTAGETPPHVDAILSKPFTISALREALVAALATEATDKKPS